MKIAICYYSRHHGNTLKVLEAMAEGQDAELFDVTSRMAFYPEQYDVIGLASPINAGRPHPAVLDFARQYLPENSRTFFVYTLAANPAPRYVKMFRALAEEKHAQVLGEYGCRGFCTFGPFKLFGGAAKGRPNEEDLQKAREFFLEKVVGA